jgi:hypothetical protein
VLEVRVEDVDVGLIAGVVSAVIVVGGVRVAVWKWVAGRVRKRRTDRVVAESQKQRSRRRTTLRPTRRRKDGGWVFRGIGI